MRRRGWNCGVPLVEDEAGTEFKFCDDEPTSVFPSSAASSSERLPPLGELTAHREASLAQPPQQKMFVVLTKLFM